MIGTTDNGDPGERANPLLVLIVAPFYLTWATVRSLARAVVAALKWLGASVGRLISRGLALVLRVAAWSFALVARLVRPIAHTFTQILSRLVFPIRAVLSLMRAGLGRALRLVGDVAMFLIDAVRPAVFAVARPVVRVVADVMGVVRSVLIALGTFLRPFARALGAALAQLGRILQQAVHLPRRLFTAVGRILIVIVSAPGRLLRLVFQRVGSVIVVALRPVARFLSAFGHALLTGVIIAWPHIRRAASAARHLILAALAPILAVVGQVASAYLAVSRMVGRRLVLAVATGAAVSRVLRAAVRAARDELGLAVRRVTRRGSPVRQARPAKEAPLSQTTNDVGRAGRHPRRPPDNVAAPPDRDRSDAASERVASIAATTAVVLLVGSGIAAIGPLKGETWSLVLFLGAMFVVGVAVPPASGRHTVAGVALGLAAAILVGFGIDLAQGIEPKTSPLPTWLMLNVVAWLTLHPGRNVGRRIRRRSQEKVSEALDDATSFNAAWRLERRLGTTRRS